jgi:tRNA (guanine37-N1)-methyltransferase
MVMKPEPLFAAVEAVMGNPPTVPILLLTPQGRPLTQSIVQELARHPHLGLVCGHYEGVDERVRQYLVTDQISIGDYVLTGGEIPALVLIDSVARLVPGVLGDGDSALQDSFSDGGLEYPHYTRPAEFRGWKVPDILLSGHHAEIAEWRRRQSLLRTWLHRPDLLRNRQLSEEDEQFLEDMKEKL